MAIGNGRQAGGGLPICPDALLDDGLLDLMILPELEAAQRLDVLASLLQHGARSIETHIVRMRAPWVVYQAEVALDINLDGEPLRKSSFRIECVPQALPVHGAMIG
jgi:diacylglycerol kinase family enzyme